MQKESPHNRNDKINFKSSYNAVIHTLCPKYCPKYIVYSLCKMDKTSCAFSTPPSNSVTFFV